MGLGILFPNRWWCAICRGPTLAINVTSLVSLETLSTCEFCCVQNWAYSDSENLARTLHRVDRYNVDSTRRMNTSTRFVEGRPVSSFMLSQRLTSPNTSKFERPSERLWMILRSPKITAYEGKAELNTPSTCQSFRKPSARTIPEVKP